MQLDSSIVVACKLLVAARVGSSSLTRDQTQAPCIGSVESYALCHRGSPCFRAFVCASLCVYHSVEWKYDFEEREE